MSKNRKRINPKSIIHNYTITKKLLTISTLSPLSPKLTNGENVKVVKMSDLFCFLALYQLRIGVPS